MPKGGGNDDNRANQMNPNKALTGSFGVTTIVSMIGRAGPTTMMTEMTTIGRTS